MEWLEPWWSTEECDSDFHELFRAQLERELPPGHKLFGLPVKLIARGNGDDALFEILDGSGRVAVVHLTWRGSQEQLPWPGSWIYNNIDAFTTDCMLPEHQDWEDGQQT